MRNAHGKIQSDLDSRKRVNLLRLLVVRLRSHLSLYMEFSPV